MNPESKVAILGAGLVGSLLSILLTKKGVKVEVFEKRSDIRLGKAEEGRSINLALSHRGIRSLELAGIYESIAPALIPMHSRMMHAQDQGITAQRYGKPSQHINSVSRNELTKLLIEEAERLGVKFYFDAWVEKVDLALNTVFYRQNHISDSRAYSAIFGTDGVNSVVRNHILSDHNQYEERFLDHGYKELTIPAVNGDFALDPNHLHIWPRGRFMLIALPNPDKTFTATLFLAYKGNKASFEQLKDPLDVELFFETQFPDVMPLIPDLKEQFTNNPTSKLGMIKCFPWHKNESLLLGDSAHAIVPFYGQGMNAGFEDCRLFIDELVKHQFDWKKSMNSFQLSRKKDTDAIAYLALKNFMEMRDHVSNDRFLAQKKLEADLHQEYPEDWIPLYTMVTFTDIPYSLALQLSEIQQKLLDQIPNLKGLTSRAKQDLVDLFKSQAQVAQLASL